MFFSIVQCILSNNFSNSSSIICNVEITRSSSMLVFHFSKFILLIAHFSCRGMQNAACTTAVAPTPEIKQIIIIHNFK